MSRRSEDEGATPPVRTLMVRGTFADIYRMEGHQLAVTASRPNRRRSQRVLLRMGVVVSGTRDGRSFSEKTVTAIVSAHGALLLLQQSVAPKEKLVVKNAISLEDASCRVVDV